MQPATVTVSERELWKTSESELETELRKMTIGSHIRVIPEA